MVAAIPVRFKRVAAAFEEVAKMKGCGSGSSSGSEHSPIAEGESLRDLSDMVNSFLEKGSYGNFDRGEKNRVDFVVGDFDDFNHGKMDIEEMDLMDNLLSFEDGDEVRREILSEVEEGLRIVGDSSSPEFKRRLMTRLRDRGLDAGLCKSKWEKTGRLPSGYYEYIDVNKNGGRYIIEVSLATEFDIARPTDHYKSLLENLPSIYVSKVQVLKQVVSLMCNAIKKSMKSVKRHVPPWRRHEYVQAKWFGSYKRTMGEIPKGAPGIFEDSSKKRPVGLLPVTNKVIYCSKYFVSKNNVSNVGNLSIVINGYI